MMVALVLCATHVLAQDSTRDVLYLKNGSIIKVSVVQMIPKDTIVIQMFDGSFGVYAMSDVVRFEKETVKLSQAPTSAEGPAPFSGGNCRLVFQGGISSGQLFDMEAAFIERWSAAIGVVSSITSVCDCGVSVSYHQLTYDNSRDRMNEGADITIKGAARIYGLVMNIHLHTPRVDNSGGGYFLARIEFCHKSLPSQYIASQQFGQPPALLNSSSKSSSTRFTISWGALGRLSRKFGMGTEILVSYGDDFYAGVDLTFGFNL